MAFSTDNYRIAKEAIDRRRAEAVSESERRRAELHLRCPEAEEIDRALRKTGMALFRAACEGGKGSAAFQKVMEENRSLIEAREALLLSLGLPADYTEVHYTCPTCGDSGYVDIKMCDCLRRELVLAGFRSSGLGTLIERQSFDNFSLDYYSDTPENAAQMKRVLAFVRRYAEGFTAKSGNLLFLGGTGLGKTHLSTAVARVAIERGFDVRYESAQSVFSAFEEERFRSRREGEEAKTEKYFSVDLLILDDLGTEASTAFTDSCLYNLINTRLIESRPTVISTNLTSDGLVARYGERVVSRLFGEYCPLHFVGGDVRRQKLL